MENVPSRRGQLLVSVGLFGHYEVGSVIKNYLKIVSLPSYYAFCIGWSSISGQKIGQILFPELEYSQVPIIGYPRISEIGEKLESLGYSPGIVIITDADRFCDRDNSQVAQLLQLSKALQSGGTNVVITGKPTPQMFVLMSHAEVPVRSQTPVCRAQHKTGVCGHPASAWVWCNCSGIVPIYEFLRILLTPISWIVSKMVLSAGILELLNRNSKTHYPQTFVQAGPFYPGWLVWLQTFLFGPLELQGRCFAHQDLRDREEPILIGEIALVTGSVDAAKSLYLADVVREYTHGSMGNSPLVAIFAPSERGSRSRIIPGYEPTPVKNVGEIVIGNEVLLVTIDEAWCFDEDLETLLIDLKARGATCYLATYQVSGDGHPFDNTARLLHLADKIIVRQGQCYVCGDATSLTQVVCRDSEDGDWYLLPDEDFGPDHIVTLEAFVTHQKLNFLPVCGKHFTPPPKQKGDSDAGAFLEIFEATETNIERGSKTRVGRIKQDSVIIQPAITLLGLVLFGLLLGDVVTNPLRYLYPGVGLGILLTIFGWWRFCLVYEDRWKRRFFVVLLTFCSITAPPLILWQVLKIAELSSRDRAELWQYATRMFGQQILNLNTVGLVMSIGILSAIAVLYRRVIRRERKK